MDIKYNIYTSIYQNGPWTLANSTPIDHDQTGNEYTITGLSRGGQYYIMVVGGYIDGSTFVPLMYQPVGPNPEEALGVGKAPGDVLLIRNYTVRKLATTELGHQFEVTI